MSGLHRNRGGAAKAPVFRFLSFTGLACVVSLATRVEESIKKKMAAKALIIATLAMQVVLAAGQDTKPHILMMLVDDWGWADVGFHRDEPTPEVATQQDFDDLKTRERM